MINNLERPPFEYGIGLEISEIIWSYNQAGDCPEKISSLVIFILWLLKLAPPSINHNDEGF